MDIRRFIRRNIYDVMAFTLITDSLISVLLGRLTEMIYDGGIN